MAENDILQKQIDYYRARAQEYDESITQTGRFAHEPKFDAFGEAFAQVMDVARKLPAVERVLELAAGTGIWTSILADIGRSVTAVDASPEMIAINREKVHSDRVEYVCANLFDWTPDKAYDLVFFGFWLSHVPPELLSSFLDKVYRATRPGGTVFIVDEWASSAEELAVTQGYYQERTLADGSQYTIVKVYYDPDAVEAELNQLGFENLSHKKNDYFFYLSGSRVG